MTSLEVAADWKGVVPPNWKLRKLKFVSDLIKVRAMTPAHDDGLPVALENIESYSGRLIETESALEGELYEFTDRDLLYGKLRPYLCKVLMKFPRFFGQ